MTPETDLPPSDVVDAGQPASAGCAPTIGSDRLSMDEWEAQGGDTDGILRTVCHECDRMFSMDQMTEDDRHDNICPGCIADVQGQATAPESHE